MRLPEATWEYKRLPEATWEYMRLPEATWEFMRLPDAGPLHIWASVKYCIAAHDLLERGGNSLPFGDQSVVRLSRDKTRMGWKLEYLKVAPSTRQTWVAKWETSTHRIHSGNKDIQPTNIFLSDVWFYRQLLGRLLKKRCLFKRKSFLGVSSTCLFCGTQHTGVPPWIIIRYCGFSNNYPRLGGCVTAGICRSLLCHLCKMCRKE